MQGKTNISHRTRGGVFTWQASANEHVCSVSSWAEIEDEELVWGTAVTFGVVGGPASERNSPRKCSGRG